MAIKLLIEVDDSTSVVELTNRAYKLGRSSKADLRLNDSLISGIHCEISMTRNAVINVRDLESTNGTFINGSKIVSQKFFIGDTLTIGKYSISIDIKSLTQKEYKSFYNAERTSIRFIDAGLKTKSIQHNIYEETKKNVVKDESQNIKDINLNFETASHSQLAAPEKPHAASKLDPVPSENNEPEDIEQKTDVAPNDCEFGFQNPTISQMKIIHDPKEAVEEDESLSLLASSTKNGYKSSGQTQFLQLSDKTGTRNKINKKKLSEPRPKKTKKKEKKKSLLEKILGIFKG
ncbi:FHA domain-containing protein [Bacteriovorax sp. Seq25_V]|uniref:FHA domain-containing protein n=1 Tax=Bacteriovorax sp. Seq25_V TaxID=1201288 RepID=UPI000389E40E|nr:FHA domain-containing protein [Bacteriovorax sp. Seq25_V]EQC43372.1 FHA domain protein [Bacteriovorax sp. Seq25_V]